MSSLNWIHRNKCFGKRTVSEEHVQVYLFLQYFLSLSVQAGVGNVWKSSQLQHETPMVRTLLLPFLGIFGGLLSAFIDITAKGLDRKSGERERERERRGNSPVSAPPLPLLCLCRSSIFEDALPCLHLLLKLKLATFSPQLSPLCQASTN